MTIKFNTIKTFKTESNDSGITPDKKIIKGTVFNCFKNLEPTKNTPHSFQVGPNLYLRDDRVISKVNHSCEPNIIVDVDQRQCVAIMDILPGEALTYFYPSTEYNKMHTPFKCLCGSVDCIEIVDGAVNLDPTFLRNRFINKFILDHLNDKAL